MHRLVGVVLLGCLLVGEASPSWAQDRQVGLTLGFNLATMQAPAAELGYRPSFAAGLVLRQPAFGPVSLQSELLLNQKGAAVLVEEGGSIRYGAGYLELPILVHAEGPTIRSLTVHGQAGGFGGVKLFEQQRAGGEGFNLPLRTGRTFFTRFDAGVVAGVGGTLLLEDRQLTLTVRHGWGLVDVAQEIEQQPIPDAPFPSEAQTRTWSLLVRFGL